MGNSGMNIRTRAVVAWWATLLFAFCAGIAPCAQAVAGDSPRRDGKLVVVEGDSISIGQKVNPRARYSALLEGALNGVHVLNVAKGAESLDVGQPGRVPHAGMAYTWEKQVLARNPDVIVLMSGTNDIRDDFAGDIDARLALFEFHLRDMLDAAQAHVNPDGSRPVVIVMSPPPARDPSQAVFPRGRFTSSCPKAGMEKLVARAAAVVADYPGVRWVDNYRLWERVNRARGGGTWFVTHLTVDGVHPNGLGHRLIASALLPVVADALGGVPTTGLLTAPRRGGGRRPSGTRR
jgi:lysophospholipase L1-like esterase